jgi:hypothetical protein
MKNILKKGFAMLVLLLTTGGQLWAQCAMCRGTVESTMGNGRNDVGIGLNTGILYLFVMPYLIVAVIAYLWYRESRKAREQQQLLASRMDQVIRH